MNYIVYDLEFNQKYNTSSDNIDSTEDKVNASSNMPFEIIQIGALKLNENFETVATFDELIKPTLYKTIHPYVENLTKITNDKVALCKNFTDTYKDFLKFLGNDEIVLCVWGITDIKELIRNVEFHNLPNSKFSKYIDIQKYASKHLKTPNKSKVGLRNAIDFLEIPITGEFHDAFNDAHYTTEVFKLINKDDIKSEIYTPSNSNKRISKAKENIDMAALINQFEKMYDRKMSQEEKSIIKLAYMMGKTRQFIL